MTHILSFAGSNSHPNKILGVFTCDDYGSLGLLFSGLFSLEPRIFGINDMTSYLPHVRPMFQSWWKLNFNVVKGELGQFVEPMGE